VYFIHVSGAYRDYYSIISLGMRHNKLVCRGCHAFCFEMRHKALSAYDLACDKLCTFLVPMYHAHGIVYMVFLANVTHGSSHNTHAARTRA